MSDCEKIVKPLDKSIGSFRSLRARMFSLPFVLVHEMTNWEFTGQDKLIACIEDHQRTGRGLITVSNHVSLFDDPLVFIALLGLRFPTEATKCWYSTACAANFNPDGKGLNARITRYFSEVSNMVFLSRAHKREDDTILEGDPIRTVLDRFDERLARHASVRASSLGIEVDTYVRAFLTPWSQGTPPSRIQTYNQAGLLEACVRVDSGDWVHFFPEGGRSRDLHLRPARPGVGKVLYNCREARVLPVCFYGTQDILPVGSRLPRPGKHVHVSVGDPISISDLERLRRRPNKVDTYQALSDLAMDHIAALRPGVLARYLGPDSAARLLLEEAQMKRALEPEPQSIEERIAFPAEGIAYPAATRRVH